MIETTITKIQYDADGVQRRWSIPFQYADAKHISIYTKVGNEPTVKVADNYDIDEDDSVVIYPTVASGQEPLVAGTKITIARETPETQLEDASQVHFTSKDVERGLDKLTMITQELSTTAGETMEVSSAAFESAEEAVSTANEANATADEAKTLAGQAVSVANDANATATSANTKSDTAIKIANDANEKSASAVSTASAAKTVVDEANSTDNKANAIATEAKEIAAAANVTAINADKIANEADKKADNAIIIATDAKSIAEGIDAKAVQALDNSNTAINTANSAKQTAEGIDSKATQALANSTTALETATEAKNTADSCQGQITTIESKIPSAASETNQLATKAELAGYLPVASKAVANGVASLDANTKVPVAQIPDLSSTYATINSLATVATSGSYNDLTNKPTIPTVGNATITIQKNGTKVDSFTANQASAKTINITVPTTAADVSALPASTKYGYSFDLSIDSDTYVISLTMKDQNGTAIGTAQTIDLPLESVVVSGSYDNTNKKIVLTLQSGSTVDVPVGDLIDGLQTEITSTNKLSADLIKDGTTNKIVTATEKSTWNGKQNAITDLATIRSGASKGATAVQPGDLATVATSGMYSDLTGTPVAATVDTLGLVKPDGNTITVTEDGTISATGGSGSGSGFDFEGTKAEFDAAVAAGTITEDSVSLITDDVDGANVATKAELQAVDSSKADTSLSNLTTAGKEFASGLGMPSDGYINLKLGAADSMYIAPANGWLVLNATANNSSNFIQLKNVTSRITSSDYGTTKTTPLTTFLPVKTTDLINITYASISTTGVIFRFVYAQGAE